MRRWYTGECLVAACDREKLDVGVSGGVSVCGDGGGMSGWSVWEGIRREEKADPRPALGLSPLS